MRLVRYHMSKKGTKPMGKPTGPPQDWTWKVSGLTWKDLKKHYSIIPIYGLTFVAACMAGAYVLRLATKHPEVSWTNRNKNPWDEYKNKQYKFLAAGRDYSRGTPAPPIKK